MSSKKAFRIPVERWVILCAAIVGSKIISLFKIDDGVKIKRELLLVPKLDLFYIFSCILHNSIKIMLL